LQEGLRTANIAGTTVTFELMRGTYGKPQARNLRPVGGVPPGFLAARGGGYTGTRLFAALPTTGTGSGDGGMPGRGSAVVAPPAVSGVLPVAGEPPKRALSPHAGSRAIAGVKAQQAAAAQAAESSDSSSRSSRSRSSRRKKKKKKKKKTKRRKGGSRRSGSSESVASISSRGAASQRKRSRRRRRSSSSSSAGSSPRTGGADEATAAGTDASTPVSSEDRRKIEEAKKQVLVKLERLQKIDCKEARMKEWRSLLRAWHPDKRPDEVSVATAVFQFLQKGKLLLDLK